MPDGQRGPRPAPQERDRRGWWAAVALLVVTVGQLLVATLVPGLPQFEGKAFAGRLLAYPVLMLLVPASYAVSRRRRGDPSPLPWTAFALLMLPFGIDVTGNTADLYDRVVWWDDANHLVNWFLLALGVGLLLARADVRPRWALGLLVAGLGALLAVGWEAAEWFTFIRHGTELGTAYTDTLGDEVLGCLGAAAAAVLVSRRARPPAPAGPGDGASRRAAGPGDGASPRAAGPGDGAGASDVPRPR